MCEIILLPTKFITASGCYVVEAMRFREMIQKKKKKKKTVNRLVQDEQGQKYGTQLF